jgi:hypothetical protein
VGRNVVLVEEDLDGASRRRTVSKGVEDGRRPPALRPGQWPPLQRPLGRFIGGPPTGPRRAGHGGPGQKFRESIAMVLGHRQASTRP